MGKRQILLNLDEKMQKRFVETSVETSSTRFEHYIYNNSR
ncbi:unnamed protein product, partial [marine sediment metagenome]